MNKTIFPLKKPIKNIFFLWDKDGDIKYLIDIDTWYVRVKKLLEIGLKQFGMV